MNLFGKRQAPALDVNAASALLARVGELESAVRRLQADFEDMHLRYVKDKRTAAADRRNQEREMEQQEVDLPVTPDRAAALWGARARRRGGSTNGG